jgi:saccharopine dehydrogenase (NADP+, L-glutamate forming)
MSEYGFQADWRISEFIRGTLRLKGWAEAWREIFALVEQAEGDAGVRLLESKSEELWRAYQYQPGELDRVVLSVDLEVKRDGETVWHQVHCLDETGNEHGTAMARLVSLTCSLAVDSVLQGKLRAGVMGAPNEMVLIDDWLGKLSQMGEKMQRIELV